MRWHWVGTSIVALVMAGCPSEFGREGRVAKAVHKDTMEAVNNDCPEDMYEKYCSDGREQTAECIKECG